LDNFTWNRQKKGDFAFMEQDFEYEAPAVPGDKVTTHLMLDWAEGGCLPEPTGKIVNTSGKAGAQILHPPLGDDSSPSGDSALGR
jgi:hypothetical protein